MKKGIVYTFILCVICMAVIGLMRQYMLTELVFLSVMMVCFASFYFLLRESFRATSKAAKAVKTESTKAFTSINLFYRLEKLNLSRGVKQLNAGKRKSKILMRLIKRRFTEKSLTFIRFRQEIEVYAQKITQNLEQIACNKESLSSLNPRIWQDQIRQLQRAGSALSNTAIEELQQNLMSYESLGKQCKDLLSENDQLLAQMDKTILALSQENNKVFIENSQSLLTGKDSFTHKFLHHNFNHSHYGITKNKR